MPQLEKTWQYKSGYTRSTGEVRHHRQRYGTRLESVRTKDVGLSDVEFKYHRFPFRRTITLKFRGPVSKEIQKDLEEHGFVYSPKKDEYYLPRKTFISRYSGKKKSKKDLIKFFKKLDEKEDVIVYEDKTITKPLHNAIRELGREPKEYTFYIDFEKLDNAQERALFVRHGKTSAVHEESEDWEFRGHTHPYSSKFDAGAMPSPQDVVGSSFGSAGVHLDDNNELAIDPSKGKQRDLFLGSDGKLREIKVVNPKQRDKFVLSELDQMRQGNVFVELVKISKHSVKLRKRNTKRKKLSPNYIDDYNDYIERKTGIRAEELPQDQYGNYILRDVVAK